MQKGKRLLSLLLVCCLLLGCMPMAAGAEETIEPEAVSGTCGENVTWSYDTETATLTISGTGEMEDYGESAPPYAHWREFAKTITITPGVTSIGSDAFWGFAVCAAVNIPGSVKKIGKHAFSRCYKLLSLSIPDGVEYVGASAFSMCENLASVEMADSVIEIGDNAFEFCFGLASVKLSKSLKKIGVCAFCCAKALTSVEIPAGVEELSGFHSCQNLAAVIIPEGVTSLGAAAFCNCSSLYAVQVPKSVKQIDATSFIDSGWLTVYGEKGSYAETFAKENGIRFAVGKIPSSSSVLSRFNDVFGDEYYADAVIWASLRSIVAGTDDTHFSPNQSCTRAQAVTFLWRAAGSPELMGEGIRFIDVKAGSYYEKAVQWAAENGITAGTGDEKFSPEAVCTRAQIVAFLHRAARSPEASGGDTFSDVKPGEYYEAAVRWAVEQGITAGTGNGKFGPNERCTRAQIVAFLYRYKA